MEITYQQACELIQEADGLNNSQIENLRNQRLSVLVQYAKEHSPLFGELYKDVDVNNITLDKLAITEKEQLAPRIEDWFTDRRLTLPLLKHYLEQEPDASNRLLGQYTALTTSGTTGNPLIMVRDNLHNVVHGALLNLRLFRGIDSSMMNPAHSRIASVIFTSGQVSSYASFVKMRKAYPDYAENLIAISVLEPLSAIVKKLNDFQPDILTGYPSVLANLAQEKQIGHLHINPKIIVCSAEMLTNDHYNLMRKVFGCPVLNNYCSTEGGELAMSCSEGYLHVNSDWIIIEAVDENDKKVEDGALADSILVTDLSNFVQPVIRYRMKDQVRISQEPCSCGSHLPRVEVLGRTLDSFFSNGHTINPFPLYCRMHDIKGFLEYQFVQENVDTIQCRYILAQGFTLEDVSKILTPVFEQFLQLNDGGGINFVYVEGQIIKSTKGGKSKPVLNLI